LNGLKRRDDTFRKGRHMNAASIIAAFFLELRMIRKLALGLVAAATVGAAALAPTAASAFTVKVGPTWHPHHHHVYVAPPLYLGAPQIASAPSCLERRLVQTRKGLRWRTVNVCAF
jgi:hypothetical protein